MHLSHNDCSPSDILQLIFFLEREERRERNTNLLFHPFMHSLVASCTLAASWTRSLGVWGQCFNQLSYLARAWHPIFMLYTLTVTFKWKLDYKLDYTAHSSFYLQAFSLQQEGKNLEGSDFMIYFKICLLSNLHKFRHIVGTASRGPRANFMKTFRKRCRDTSQQNNIAMVQEGGNMIQQCPILMESLSSLRMTRA